MVHNRLRLIACGLVLLALLVGLPGCRPDEALARRAAATAAARVEATAASEPSMTPTAVLKLLARAAKLQPVTATESLTATVAPEAPLPELPAPRLLAPHRDYRGAAVELRWEWDDTLRENEWFELQIWPDRPDAEPQVYACLTETHKLITAAQLAPGPYLWRVAVTQGCGDTRVGELTPYSEIWRFVLVRPYTLARPTVTPAEPVATATKRPWYPQPSRTPTPVKPTVTGQPTTQPTVPGPTVPAPTIPAPTIPAPTIPAQTVPAPTIPAQTVPAPTVPAQTVPAPTTPAQTVPAPTVPAPTTPAQTVPAPTIPPR